MEGVYSLCSRGGRVLTLHWRISQPQWAQLSLWPLNWLCPLVTMNYKATLNTNSLCDLSNAVTSDPNKQYIPVTVITMRSLFCGLWSQGNHGNPYEAIVVWPVVMGTSWWSLWGHCGVACGHGDIMVITMRSLCCGLWSRGHHGDHYEIIVIAVKSLWSRNVADCCVINQLRPPTNDHIELM